MRGFIVACVMLAWAEGAHAAQDLAVYGRLPTLEQVEISPDGKRLAIIETNGEARTLVVRGVAAGSPAKRIPAAAAKIRDLRWAGSDHLILTISTTSTIMDVKSARAEQLMAYDVDVETGKPRALMAGGPTVRGSTLSSYRGPGATLNTVEEPPSVADIDGRPVLMIKGTSFPGEQGVLTLFRDDLQSGFRIAEVGDVMTRDWVLDRNGRILAESRINRRDGAWTIQLRTPSGSRNVLSGSSLSDAAQLIGPGRSAGSILLAKYDDDGAMALFEATEQGLSAPFAQSGSASAIYGPVSGLMIGATASVGDESGVSFFDTTDQKLWDAVVKVFPGDRVTLASWSRDRRKVVVLADSPTDGPAYAIVDLDAKSADWIGNQYAGLQPKHISPVQAVAFKAADGLDLTGYLTLPQGREAKNLPLIVFPHGGPEARDWPGYNWWVQGMASRGYAVLQVNFRGSDGFGRAFRDAGIGEWGAKMQTDLSDGVRYLKDRGLIDPRRVCIVGGSYGGYAALAGATLDQGVYRCAASYAGVSDLPRLMAYEKARGGRLTAQYLQSFVGVAKADDPLLAARSPARIAAKTEIPVLLIHGKDDTVVPVSQSRVMYQALRAAGRPSEYVELEGEDHWLTSGGTRQRTLEAIMTFVEKHNPPG